MGPGQLIGSTLKVSLLRVKILLVLKSVLRTVADSRIGQVLCTKIIQHFMQAYVVYLSFPQKKKIKPRQSKDVSLRYL